MSTNTLPAPVASPLMPFEQQVRLAEAFAKSGLFGVKSADQALTLMALCEAEGLHPATAVRDYHIINGRPSLKAEVMLARFLKSGGKVKWHERTDQAADATFTHPSGGEVRVNFTILMAKVAGLVGKDVWKAYPRAMLHARCVSEGVRAVCPQATGHVYTPEEVGDMPAPNPYIEGEVVDNTRRDGYAQRLRDALDMDLKKFSEDDIANAIGAIHDELNGDQDLYRSVWTQFHSKDRKEIKEYIKIAKANGDTKTRITDAKTAEYLSAATGRPPPNPQDHSDFIKEYEDGRA